MRAAAQLLALCWALGCGSPPPPAYASAREQAALSVRRGDHLLAAQHYEQAARSTSKQRDADEARYLAADSYARAAAPERASPLLRELAGRHGEQQARAAFELADLQLQADEQAGQAELARAIRSHPDSGLARSALAKHLRYLREHGGSDAVLAYLERELQALGASELAEALLYGWARELDETGQNQRARDAYLACAARYPYPTGAYWDDSLYRAAQKELQLGSPQAALEHLARLLIEQESASLNGSYQRPRYAQGQLLVAEIYRDRLSDPARARRELRKLWQKHPKSQLVDDALFQEALLAHSANDAEGTCAPLRILTSQLPESRYAPCAHLLCDALPASTGRDCRDYIKRAAQLH
ncbi:MAG TPA: tetratricopeptide repeat protein [Polyangiaceae bacterium]